MSHSQHIKLGLVGQKGVGKTYLINKLLTGQPPDNPTSTIAVEFATTIFELGDGSKFKAEIWDTSGHQIYKGIVCAHLADADGIVMVFDVTDERSFEEVQKWMGRIKAECKDGVVLMLLGNKLDLVKVDPLVRKVATERAREWAEKKKMQFYQTSSNGGEFLEEIFEEMIESIVLKRAQRNIQLANGGGRGLGGTPCCHTCILF